MSQEMLSKQEKARQLRRARSSFRRINSLDLIPEDPSQESCSSTDENSSETDIIRNAKISKQQQQMLQKAYTRQDSTLSLSAGFRKILLFWPNLFVHLMMIILRYLLYIPLSIAAPSFWLSALLWIFWKLIRIPYGFIKWILPNEGNGSGSSVTGNGSATQHKRTILISCGSTIQTLHLARNFYSAGARVVVFDFDGLFGLARFSCAVDKYYMVSRPLPSNVDSYIAALCHIVNKEKPSVYIPVCATSPAYYDSMAKPHLELLGCASFIPGVQETTILDDCLEFYQRCAAQKINLPPYTLLSSMQELLELYDSGYIGSFRNILMAVGMQGILERYKYILPNNRRDFKFAHDISERQQWMIVRDIPGDHYVTCTTVKDSRVVANVTCKVEHESKNLIPLPKDVDGNGDEEAQIELWLKNFFYKVRFQRPINGHISFRMVKCKGTGEFLPLGVRLGVALPYICYNRSHAQVLCRTMKCVHKRQLCLVNNNSSDEETVATNSLNNWRWSAIERNSATAALDKREALFAFWDPLPYCAYYHFQLPLKSVKTFLQRRHQGAKGIKPRLAIQVN